MDEEEEKKESPKIKRQILSSARAHDNHSSQTPSEASSHLSSRQSHFSEDDDKEVDKFTDPLADAEDKIYDIDDEARSNSSSSIDGQSSNLQSSLSIFISEDEKSHKD